MKNNPDLALFDAISPVVWRLLQMLACACQPGYPHDRVQEPNPEARAVGAKLIADGTAAGPARKTLIYVNNRLEGNALETISVMVEE